MKASFVIVSYNRKDDLLFTLKSTEELIKNSGYEIIIVDNASTDGSADAIQQLHPGVILIRNVVNAGAPAWNLGFKIAKGDYFIILDDDSHIEHGLEGALGHMDQNPEIGVLALNVVTGPYTSEMWNWQDGQDTVGFIGCGAVIRRKTYETIGGYAEWMFLYVNEWEYGLRCINSGFHVQFFANCKVVHRASVINRTSKRLHVFVTKHELGIVYKHFSYKRFNFLFRVAVNNLKLIKNLEFKKAWYNLLGIIQFFKLAKELKYTPVSFEAQKMFAENFVNTKTSAFGFIFEGFAKVFEKNK